MLLLGGLPLIGNLSNQCESVDLLTDLCKVL